MPLRLNSPYPIERLAAASIAQTSNRTGTKPVEGQAEQAWIQVKDFLIPLNSLHK